MRPPRATLGFSSTESKRMRVAFTHDPYDSIGIREVWIMYELVRTASGSTSRGYLYDDPEGTGTEHRISGKMGEVNIATMAPEIAAGESNDWRLNARPFWKSRFGEVKWPAKQIKIPQEKERSNNMTGVRSESDSSSLSRFSTSLTRDHASTPYKPSSPTVGQKRQAVGDESERKRVMLQSMEIPMVIEMATPSTLHIMNEVETLRHRHGLAQDVSPVVSSHLRIILQIQAHTTEKLPSIPIEAIRDSTQNVSNSDAATPPRIMHIDPRYKTWKDQTTKVPLELESKPKQGSDSEHHARILDLFRRKETYCAELRALAKKVSS